MLAQESGKIGPLDPEMTAGKLECWQLSGVNPPQDSGIADATTFRDKAYRNKFRGPLLVYSLQAYLPSASLDCQNLYSIGTVSIIVTSGVCFV